MHWDHSRNWKKARKAMNAEALLASMGLERRSSPAAGALGGLGLFALGVLVGAGLGLMFAPQPGDQMRSRLTDELKRRRQGQQGDDLRHLGIDVAPPVPSI
jgi:hypothetical protein